MPVSKAKEKRKRNRQSDIPPGSFSSGLSVDEFLLVDAAGFDPVGLVGGGSAVHIGYQWGTGGQIGELNVVSDALYHARRSAMQQLERQAVEVGADGIVDLQLEIDETEEEHNVIQVTAFGTAVRGRDAHVPRPSHGVPFSTTLSGQDFWTLCEGGYRPLRVVMGCVICWIGKPQSWIVSWQQRGKNMEMTALTEGMYDAREGALQRMEEEAHACRAEGIVGVRVEVRPRFKGTNIEFFALGTAITAVKGGDRLPPPMTAIDLRL